METLIKFTIAFILIICTTNLFPQEEKESYDNPFSYEIYWLRMEKYILVKSPQFTETTQGVRGDQLDKARIISIDTIQFIDTLGTYFNSPSWGIMAEIIGKGGIYELFKSQKERIANFPEETKIIWTPFPRKQRYQPAVLLKPVGNTIYVEPRETIPLGENSEILDWIFWFLVILFFCYLALKSSFYELEDKSNKISWGSIWFPVIIGAVIALFGGSCQAVYNDPIGAYINLILGGVVAVILYGILAIKFFLVRRKNSN